MLLAQSPSTSQRSPRLPSEQIEPPTQILLRHWASPSHLLPADPSEHTEPVGLRPLMQILLRQSEAREQSAPLAPLVHNPELLPPVAQRADAQSVPTTHQPPSVPSVHRP